MRRDKTKVQRRENVNEVTGWKRGKTRGKVERYENQTINLTNYFL